MKTLALLLAILLTACASKDGFIADEVENCQPGSDIELQVGTGEGQILPDGRVVVLVEVANNSDHDFTVQSVRIDSVPPQEGGSQYELQGATRNFDREVPEAEDALFEIPVVARSRRMIDDPTRQRGFTAAVEVAVTVKLTDGGSARCRFAIPLRF
jgi:hypothetical protein